MKKIKYLVLAALALTGLAACTSDNIADETTPEEKFKDGAYMTINVVTDNSGTRADGDLSFTNGTPTESQVNKVLCLFYDNGGKYLAYRSFKPGTTDPSEGTPEVSDKTPGGVTDGSGNIEKIVGATIVLQGEQILARKMLVVVNAPDNSLVDKSLSEAKATLADFSAHSNGFVMSSTTYKNGSAVICEQDFDDSYFCKTETAAKANPVEAWVERVLAKVNVDMDDVQIEQPQIDVFNDGTDAANKITVNVVPVQIEQGPCNVVTTTAQSYLFKSISGVNSSDFNTAWSTAWNSTAFHRCYWASTPSKYGSSDENNFVNVAYPQPDDQGHFTAAQLATKSFYVQENTNQTNATKVMVYAQLRDAQNNPIELVQVKGNKYLYKVYCQMVAYKINQWFTANKATSPLTDLNNAETYFDCKRPTNGKQWDCVLSLKTTITLPTITDANGNDVDVAKEVQKICDAEQGWRWEKGRCYYFANITGDVVGNNGKFLPGVVRNHIYNVTITDIKGLGTPVFPSRPDEPIVPEKPTVETWYVAAKINTLKWRVVNQSVSLGD